MQTLSSRPLMERLNFSPEEDFLKLWDSYKSKTFKVVPGPMEPHFEIAKRKPGRFMDHPPVLGVSVGGSNTKVIIAERRNGELQIHHLRAYTNPETLTPMEECWDRFLIADPEVAAFLKSERRPIVGFSIPVPMLREGVFFHISKVPGIGGLIARDLERDAPTHHIGRNVERYFAERGVREPLLFYYSDTVIAHHGGISICEMEESDKSILLVSGTGLATCDEGNFVLTGQAPILTEDEEIFPEKATEGYQYQFIGAGKGLYSYMGRAAAIRARESDSPLAGSDLSRFFASPRDSKRAYDLWQAHEGDRCALRATEEIRRQVGERGFQELGAIASKVMDRVVSCIANSGVLTTAHMGPPASGRGHIFFFEGSITTAPKLLPRIKAEIERIISQKSLFASIGVEPPPLPETEPRFMRTPCAEGIGEEQLDLSVIGVATSAMAHNILAKGPN